tara:strand:- start:1299 stop:2036 length:738 start_codon:yes stop_codon:yes gene_type:complete
MKNDYVVLIPARYESTRLPGKPLIELSGIPMIVRTYLQCLKVVEKSKIFVVTDDHRIVKVCQDYDIQTKITSPHCPTGTDRIAEVARELDCDFYVNVQGDEPVLNPDDLDKIIKASQQNPDMILNGMCRIRDESLYRSASIPKVIVRNDDRLLYMSRAAIPANKTDNFIKAWRQVCIYSFTKKALITFSDLKTKTDIENIEDIEILRFLELGFEVKMIEMSEDSIAVDNPEDIPLVEAAISQRGL